MNLFGKKIPEQVTRLSIILLIIIVAFVFARSALVPPDFGEYGHFRGSAIDDVVSQEIKYAGHIICNDCHDDVVETKSEGYHKNVSCEVCHGPAAIHTEEPGEFELRAPRERAYCPVCHEYLPSRPTGFPQIIAASHNPMKPCISCHDPHDPRPPVTPTECSACHAQISRTKSLSHHVYIKCVYCHETPEQHKISPRQILPTKPSKREFCGNCHSPEADSPPGIPRVDLTSHGENYTCWQCHYPHLPEVRG